MVSFCQEETLLDSFLVEQKFSKQNLIQEAKPNIDEITYLPSLAPPLPRFSLWSPPQVVKNLLIHPSQRKSPTKFPSLLLK